MKLQQAIAETIAHNQSKSEVTGLDIAGAGNVLAVVRRFLEHNGHHAAAQSLEVDHMP